MNRLSLRKFACLILGCLGFNAAAVAQDGPPPPPNGVWTPPGWAERRAEFWKNREADHGAVVFFGDSITEGWGSLAADFPTLHVANRGITGDVASNMKHRIQEDVIDLAPKGVVILIGSNNVKDGHSAKDIVNLIQENAQRIHAAVPTAPIIVCKVMPRAPRDGIDSEKAHLPKEVPLVNALIEKLPAKFPYIYVCDSYTSLAKSDMMPIAEDFVDGVHPSAKGYAKWKAALMPVLVKAKLLPMAPMGMSK